MLTQRNISFVLIGRNINATTATRVENLLSGQIAIANKFGAVLDDNAGATDVDNFAEIKIHQGGTQRATDIIRRDNVVSVRTRAYAAPTEQITFVGYNGTSGSIVVTNDNPYIVRLNFISGDRSQEFPMQRILHGYYKSDTTATQAEIADGLAANINANARRRFERDIMAEVLCDNAGAAITGAPTNFTVTRDSKTVVWTGTDPTNIAIGDFLRFGGTTPATPVARVAAIDLASNTLTLADPYVGATATILVANVEVIVAATAATANFGVKLTGIARNFNLRRKVEYTKAMWETQLDGFESTPITSGQAAYLGSGTYEQVASEDLFGDIIFGNKYRKDHLYSPNLYAEAGGQYGCVTIVYDEPVDVVVGNQAYHRKTVRVWFNNTAATNATEFLLHLGDWLGTTYTF